MGDKNLEQSLNIKFCVKIGKSASEMLALLIEANGEYAMEKSSVFERHRRLKEEREDVQNDPRIGQSKTQRTDSNIDRVRTVGRSDRRLGVRLMTEELDMNRETVRQIITDDVRMRKFSAKTVRRILTDDQKQHRI
jgi:hypothetical protein